MRRRLRRWCRRPYPQRTPRSAPILLTTSFITRTSPMRRSALYLAIQQAGTVLVNSFCHCQSFNSSSNASAVNSTAANDAAGTVAWGQTQWVGQTWGRGDGTLDGNGDPTVNATFNATGQSQVLNNVSPKLKGWRDWASVANVLPASPPSPTIKLKRWFPGLSR